MNFLDPISNYFDLNQRVQVKETNIQESLISDDEFADMISDLQYDKKSGDKLTIKIDGKTVQSDGEIS